MPLIAPAMALLAAKVDLKVVSESLGHSSVAITADIYQSVLPEQQEGIVNGKRFGLHCLPGILTSR